MAQPSPPPFAWDDWYALVGGRSIRIDEVDGYLRQIYNDQYKRFDGEVAPTRRDFPTPADAARHLKHKATEFGAESTGKQMFSREWMSKDEPRRESKTRGNGNDDDDD